VKVIADEHEAASLLDLAPVLSISASNCSISSLKRSRGMRAAALLTSRPRPGHRRRSRLRSS